MGEMGEWQVKSGGLGLLHLFRRFGVFLLFVCFDVVGGIVGETPELWCGIPNKTYRTQGL